MRRLFAALLSALLLLPAAGFAARRYAAAGGARLYAAPSEGSASPGRLYAGAPIEAGAEEGGFTLVRLASLTAYVPSDALLDAPASDGTRGGRVHSPYGTPTVVLRTLPSDAFGTAGVLPAGQALTVLGEMKGGFLLVESGGALGFLSRDELQ